jgi:hypothetical protein
MKVTIPVQVDAAELWSNVFGSGWDSWWWWRGVKYLGSADWDKPGLVSITAADPELWDDERDATITKTFSITDLTKSVAWWMERHPEQDIEDFDGDSGDCIVQHMIYGEVVWG